MNFTSALEDYGANAYLLTVNDAGPHTSHVEVYAQDDKLRCWLSRSAAKNVAVNPNISLLWAPKVHGDYSIIVNGIIEVQQVDGKQQGLITVTKSVLHRPGLRPEGVEGACPSDCLPLTFVQSG